MTGRAEFWRGLLVLGRVSNLPTVWSNCLAGWLLGGAGSAWTFEALLLGASLLYVGGMYLNDAIDVEFDRQHRRERPIPSGTVPESTVWLLAISFLLAGAVALAFLGAAAAAFSFVLLVNIVVYDVVHKWMAIGPVIMAGCRFWLFLVAASTGAHGVSGYSIWCGLVLAAYVVGLSCFARRESLNAPLSGWPVALLFIPGAFAIVINNGLSLHLGFLSSLALVVVWIPLCIRHVLWVTKRNVGRAVNGLLAGIVLVDMIATVSHASPWIWCAFLALFGLALIGQRFVPAT